MGGVCLRKIPFRKIVGAPLKEGEIRLEVDKDISEAIQSLYNTIIAQIQSPFCNVKNWFADNFYTYVIDFFGILTAFHVKCEEKYKKEEASRNISHV